MITLRIVPGRPFTQERLSDEEIVCELCQTPWHNEDLVFVLLPNTAAENFGKTNDYANVCAGCFLSNFTTQDDLCDCDECQEDARDVVCRLLDGRL